jgi:O-antigen ligase
VSLPTPLNPYRTSLLRRIGQAADLHSSSVRQRLLLYVVAADMIRAHGWVGAGPGSFSRRFGPALAAMRTPETEGAINRIAYQLGDLHPGFVHCDWLQFWVENGVLGAAGFLWLIASSAVLVRVAFRQARKRAPGLDARNRPGGVETDPQFRILCAGYAAAWFCTTVYSLFAFPFHSPDRVLLYWTLFGLMGASVGALIADEAGVAGKAGAKSPITPQPPPVRCH